MNTAPGQEPGRPTPSPSPGIPGWAKVIIAILAIIGGLTVLLVAACFGMLWIQ